MNTNRIKTPYHTLVLTIVCAVEYWLCIGSELSERVCVMGISMNLVTYLVGDLHISTSKSANIVTNFMGTLNLLSLLAGFMADAKLGRFRTVAISASVTAAVS